MILGVIGQLTSQTLFNIHPPICRITAHATMQGKSIFVIFDTNEW